MTLTEAREHLSRPLRFGDAEQIKARALINAAVNLLTSSELELCDSCDGSGDAHDDIPAYALCGRCEGHGVIDDSGDPHEGISLEIRMAALALSRDRESKDAASYHRDCAREALQG